MVAKMIFFFQAEDGIRDADVTGVQTCALPISNSGTPRISVVYAVAADTSTREPDSLAIAPAMPMHTASATDRSEERRVGKECRHGGAADHLNKRADPGVQRHGLLLALGAGRQE